MSRAHSIEMMYVTKKHIIVLIFQIIILLQVTDVLGCTTGAAMGPATVDGRPIIWHNEDLSSYMEPIIKKISWGTYDNVMIQASNGWGQGGLNEAGLARFVNNQGALGDYNGILGHISRSFASIEEVRTYLETRDYSSAYSTPIMDATGKAVMFEIGNNDYWEYNPENAMRKEQAYFHDPNFFAVRSNLAFKNSNHQEPDSVVEGWPEGSSKFRYNRAKELFMNKISDGDRLTVEDVIMISRDGTRLDWRSICRPDSYGVYHTVWGAIALGVKSGEDPKYATLLVAMGIPDYSIYFPVWVDLEQSELSSRTISWDENNIGWWPFKLYEDRYDGTADYDEYIRSVFDGVESNIIEAVKNARHNWLEEGNTARFHEEARLIHFFSSWAAYNVIRSAYETSSASNPRTCNLPPEVTSLNPQINGLTVTFNSDVSDPDGIARYRWNFGDGQDIDTEEDVSTITHTYAQPGTYLVSFYATDGRSSPSANARFEYVTVSGASCIDNDGDGYGTGAGCLGPDCNDNDANVHQTVSCNYG